MWSHIAVFLGVCLDHHDTPQYPGYTRGRKSRTTPLNHTFNFNYSSGNSGQEKSGLPLKRYYRQIRPFEYLSTCRKWKFASGCAKTPRLKLIFTVNKPLTHRVFRFVGSRSCNPIPFFPTRFLNHIWRCLLRQTSEIASTSVQDEIPSILIWRAWEVQISAICCVLRIYLMDLTRRLRRLQKATTLYRNYARWACFENSFDHGFVCSWGMMGVEA